jgi:hypothetical protein
MAVAPDQIPAALALLEGRANEGERAGNQQRGSQALGRARRDQHGGVRGEPAAEGGHREDGDSDREDLAPAVLVARSTPGQQQSCQAQGVGVDDPLHRRQ